VLPIKFWILIIFLFFSQVYPAFAQEPQKSEGVTSADNATLLSQILKQMEQAGTTLIDFKADFTQIKVFTQFEDKEESSGKVIYKKSKKALWEFEQPSPRKAIINNDIAWLYVPKVKQVQKINLKDKAQTESILLGFGTPEAEIRGAYDVNLLGAEKINQKDTYRLELIPKDKNHSSYFSKTVLWIDKNNWLPIKTQLLESNEDTITIEFHDIQLNTNVADSLFDFKVPKGVEVVDYSK
jgi:outer membrane lipoprotein-sorting protein